MTTPEDTKTNSTHTYEYTSVPGWLTPTATLDARHTALRVALQKALAECSSDNVSPTRSNIAAALAKDAGTS
jgi:hypothetical protein